MAQSGVSGEQLAVQQLCQSDIGGVVGRQVVAQLPYPVKQSEGGIPGDAETAPVVEGGPPVVNRQLSRSDSATQPTGDLRVDQVGGVEPLVDRARRAGPSFSSADSAADASTTITAWRA